MARDFCKIPPWLEFTLLGPNLDLVDWKQTAEWQSHIEYEWKTTGGLESGI
jgi:hypothetical protein